MTIFAVANEEDCFTDARPNLSWFTTSANVRDPNQTFAINFLQNDYALLAIPSVDETWLHFRMDVGSNSDNTLPLVSLRNRSTGKDAFYISNSNTASTVYFRWNSSGTTYTTIAQINGYNNLKNHIYDVYFKRGTSGVLKVWMDGNLVANFTGNYSTVDATWDAVILRSVGGSATSFGSFMVGDAPMFNHRLDTMLPDGAGTINTWNGAYTDVDDALGYADRSDAVHTNTPAAAYTFNYQAAAALSSSYEIKALMVASIGSLDAGAAISDVSLYMRHSSAYYTYASLGFVAGNGDIGGQQIFHTDPLGAMWTTSSINALEIGAIAT